MIGTKNFEPRRTGPEFPNWVAELCDALNADWQDHTLALALADAVMDCGVQSRVLALRYPAWVRKQHRREVQYQRALKLVRPATRSGFSVLRKIHVAAKVDRIEKLDVRLLQCAMPPLVCEGSTDLPVIADRPTPSLLSSRYDARTNTYRDRVRFIAVGAVWVLRYAL